MDTLVATQKGTSVLTIYTGTVPLPLISDNFPPIFGTQLYFDHTSNENYGMFVNVGGYDGSILSTKFYGVSSEGYLLYSGSVDIGPQNITIYDDDNHSTVFTNNRVITVTTTDTLNPFDYPMTVFFGLVSGVSLVDGTITSAMSSADLVVQSPYAGYEIARFGFTILNNTPALSICVYDTGSDNHFNYMVTLAANIPVQYGYLEVDTGLRGDFIPQWIAYKNDTYRALGSSSLPDWQLLDFDLVPFGDPLAPFTFYEPTFAIGDYFDYFSDAFCDGENFYIVIANNSLGDRVTPYILKVNYEWTEYERLDVEAGDAGVQARINNYLAGNGSISFAYDQVTGNILMTAGNEPMFYGVSAPAPAQYDRSTKRTVPYKLPCIVNCIPFFRG